MLSPSGCDAFFADLATCADDAGLLGGKAASLRRLAAAGLATPPAFVITHALSEALTATLKTAGGSDADNQALARAFATAPFPPGFDAALAARLAALGSHRFSVRSSFAHEDRAGEVAAGIYDSVIDVPAAEVGMALRRVLASAVSAGATAYAHARGFASTSAPLAILIHPFLAGVTHGAAAAADETSEVVVDVVAGSLSAQARAAIETAIRRLAARHGASEVEWVDLGARVVFLQLRPYQTQAPRAAWAGFADLPAGTTADEWTWDAAHNPLPLSAAHAGLVAWVDQRCRIGIRQCVLGGYLFWRPDATNQRPAATPATLHARYAAIAEAIDSDLATLAHAPALDDALTIFTRHYQPLLGELPPAANARAALHRFLAEHAAVFPDLDATLASLLTDVESEKTERQRRADAVATAADDNARQAALTAYLARFGDEALAWDLAAPTAREQPARFFPATKRSRPDTHRETTTTGPDAVTRLSERLAPADRSTFLALVAQARTAVAVGENDDWLYARLQAPVRHAITALAHRFVGKGLTAVEDAFHLSLDSLRALAQRDSLLSTTISAEVARNRARWSHARAHPPPLRARAETTHWRGHGTGGRAIGPVVLRHGPHGEHPPPDAILVATSLLPTELPLLDVAALVVESGGPLGHVATLARERRLPAVIGARGAVAALADGDVVVVDADAGIVVRTTTTTV